MSFDIDQFQAAVKPPRWCWDRLEEAAKPVWESDHIPTLQDASLRLWVMMDDPARLRLCLYAFHHRVLDMMHVAAFSTILESTWTRGKLYPLIGWHTCTYRTQRRMFEVADPQYLMTHQERTALDAMPAEIDIYRGAWGITLGQCRQGMAWSTDESCAMWFAQRGIGKPICIRAKVKKENILAYFSGGNESEIVVRPGRVMTAQVMLIRTDLVDAYQASINRGSKIAA